MELYNATCRIIYEICKEFKKQTNIALPKICLLQDHQRHIVGNVLTINPEVVEYPPPPPKKESVQSMKIN